eukprot:CAMPEP_0117051272 /NCGR_PEP_ID=MMETSP0472-20121206/35419_1 /TAXON_ID=693140 ORGANISM="Tiarina fusus, Strain LIS" /NCGR_SAMPLE_ID=MMETSP0472 /ASSEMBLY_ACC=CAM_ASM_000603 /LENGTH=119 /DNA_ID=CAMNT_0004765409 /DNA_START=462 /DNA_END=818 /DNA_ORIENTATION=-
MALSGRWSPATLVMMTPTACTLSFLLIVIGGRPTEKSSRETVAALLHCQLRSSRQSAASPDFELGSSFDLESTDYSGIAKMLRFNLKPQPTSDATLGILAQVMGGGAPVRSVKLCRRFH